MITIDILVLVDRLEELLNKSSRVPLTRSRMVDERALDAIINQMRIAVPEEIRQARRITAEGERLLADAEEAAKQVHVEAQQNAALLLSQQSIIHAAHEQAEQIVQAAREHEAKLMAEADEHCLSVLSALEDELNSLLTSTRKGIRNLHGQSAEADNREMEPGEKER